MYSAFSMKIGHFLGSIFFLLLNCLFMSYFTLFPSFLEYFQPRGMLEAYLLMVASISMIFSRSMISLIYMFSGTLLSYPSLSLYIYINTHEKWRSELWYLVIVSAIHEFILSVKCLKEIEGFYISTLNSQIYLNPRIFVSIPSNLNQQSHLHFPDLSN